MSKYFLKIEKNICLSLRVFVCLLPFSRDKNTHSVVTFFIVSAYNINIRLFSIMDNKYLPVTNEFIFY